MANLVIVESPKKCKKIAHYLGSGWVVKASVGHVRDLPVKEMGVDLQTFKPTYVANERSGKVIATLRKLVSGADAIYLATDPDREGEAIAWHLQQVLKLKDPKRVTFNEITQAAVNRAVNNPRRIDYALVGAQEGRRVLDRLVGYSVSPALSNAYGRWLTAGRVQSVALRIVVDLEREIREFKPVDYVEVYLVFRTNELAWRAKWIPDELFMEGQTHWSDRAYAGRVAGIKDVVVVSINRNERSRRPPPPFITSTLQQGASVALKMSPKQCMREAQALFEEGLISYHRTDNPNLSDEAIGDVTSWLSRNGYGEDIASPANTWKAKAGAQEGHEAIRPTDMNNMPEIVNSRLTPDQYALYRLIWQRAVACQMKAARFNVTLVDLKSTEAIDGYYPLFRAKGEKMIYPGWMKLSSQDVTDETQEKESQVLPSLSEGVQLTPAGGDVLEKQTKPPGRYTEASLVKKLESEGIGRPSTYASILDNIQQRGYVTVTKRMLYAEDLGITIVQALVNRFRFMELDYTRRVESELDQIAAGKDSYDRVVRAAYTSLSDELKSLEGASSIAPQASEQHSCPQCAKPLRLRSGRNGQFWGCQGYPDCRYTAPDDQGKPATQTGGKAQSIKPDLPGHGESQLCPECGKGTIVQRTVRQGTNQGKRFYGCTAFPACKYFSWRQ